MDVMPTALIADDNADIRTCLKARLSNCGVAVREYENATETREALTHEKFDVAILDIVMPPGDGVEAAAQIKSLHPDCPLFFLTAFAEMESARANALVHVDKWIDKGPGWLDEVESAVREVIARRNPELLAGGKEGARAAIPEELAEALREGRLRIAETHEGTVEHVHEDSIHVVYEVEDDLVEQTYERSQLIGGQLPALGDRLVAYVYVVLAKPRAEEDQASTKQDEQRASKEYRRNLVQGDDQDGN
jgi:CheY-like chemotaxis protein